METKEFKVSVPEGYEIDKENSTFECIKFKRIENPRWRDAKKYISGYYIDDCSDIIVAVEMLNAKNNHNVFATEKQAKSALAMAIISQIMANDKRFGGVVTDEEWSDDGSIKYIIMRYKNRYDVGTSCYSYRFLAFHTEEQRELFIKENEDLIKDYLMID